MKFVVVLLLCGSSAFSADLTIRIKASEPVTRKVVRYECDAAGAKLGLPSAAFEVEYLNGGGNSLAVIPIGGQSLIFVNVLAGSGARYAARQFVWWEAGGRSVSFMTCPRTFYQR